MAFRSLRRKTTEEKRQFLERIENKSTREIKNILAQKEMAPTIKVEKTSYHEKVILRLEVSHEFNEKLEKLQSFKSHKLARVRSTKKNIKPLTLKLLSLTTPAISPEA